MTATPTPLRELPAKWRSKYARQSSTAMSDGECWERDALDQCADELEAALDSSATQPASGEAAACNCASGRGAEHCVVHASNDVLPRLATPPAASGDDVGYSSADALNPNLRVLRQIAAKMPPSWEREALFHAELDLGMQIRRLAAVAPAGMVLVPREPTPEMIEAGDDLIPLARGTESRRMFPNPEAIYAAMLAAAPTPPATAGEE